MKESKCAFSLKVMLAQSPFPTKLAVMTQTLVTVTVAVLVTEQVYIFIGTRHFDLLYYCVHYTKELKSIYN